MDRKSVQVIPFQISWKNAFSAEAKRIEKALGVNCLQVLHIGSTSIPGMSAKPIIDMLPIVKNIQDVDDEALIKLGYTSRGELGMLFRRFYQRYENDIGYHLHIWEENSGEIDKHLLFRKQIIENNDDFHAYESLKLKLAQDLQDNRKAYTLAKDDLVKDILRRSGYQGKIIVEALTPYEWDSYHRILETQIYAPLSLPYNKQSQSLENPSARHFVLYKGADVIGAASLEFMNEETAALRPFAIDAAFQGKGQGRWFLEQIERWLTQKHCKKIVTHAKTTVIEFYEKLEYKPTVFKDKRFKLGSISTDLGKDLIT